MIRVARIWQWVTRGLWDDPKPNDEKEYEQALVAVFIHSLNGQIILKKWLDDIYCQVSFKYGTNMTERDFVFNEGQRHFVHELLETLHTARHRVETEEAQNDTPGN